MKLRNGGPGMARIDSEMAFLESAFRGCRTNQTIDSQSRKIVCVLLSVKHSREVVDTHKCMAYHDKSLFATRLGIVDNAAGQQLMADLEKDRNQLYSEVYEEQKSTGESGRGGIILPEKVKKDTF